MKKIILSLLSLIFIYQTYAQDITPDEIFTKEDPDFNISDIPEKWKNESAVILCQKLIYNFDRKNGKIIDKEIIRKRIKLLDKSSINKFAEFYFISTENIGINIIKPDGTLNKVDLKAAVSVSEEIEIPNFYKSNFRSKREYKKIAIPGLEVNDIIDYYYNAEAKRNLPNTFEYIFPEILISINNTYPTIKQKIEFQVEKGFNINFKNQNGAPDLQEKASPVEEIKIFYFEDSNRDKSENERWSYLYRNTPTIKFQVVYIKNAKNSDHFIGETGVPKKSVSDAEVIAKVKDLVFFDNGFTGKYRSHLGNVLKTYKKDHSLKEVPPEMIARQAYFLYRHYRYFNPEGLEAGNNYQAGEDILFVKAMFNALRFYKVDFTIVLAPPADVSDINDVVLKEELMWLVKIRDGNNNIFLFPPSFHTSFGDIPEKYYGVTAYEIIPNQDTKLYKAERIQITPATPANNTEKTSLVVDLDADFSTFNIKRTVKATGIQKESQQFMLYYFDVAMEEYGTYQRTLYPYYISFGTKDYERQNKYIEKVSERLQNDIKTDFELVKYGKYEIDYKGRGYLLVDDSTVRSEKNPFVFHDDFTIKGLLKKAGSNYFFEAGKLLGAQVEIPEKELERKFNINYNPRAYQTEIKFKIPEGYTLEGIENLNMNISNETGHFISSAAIEEEYLIIQISKQYTHAFEKKEDWPKVVAFLNAANKFTQVKVLMKKKI
ncbi:MAG: DUF3857 domain-containing protein [Cytophagaceae bacterium]|nr:DUF3857 domain-containing protein [Cytophagaceae bacterium]